MRLKRIRLSNVWLILSSIFLFLISVLIPVQSFAQDTCIGSINIELANIQNETGGIEIGLYSNPDEWPYNPSYNFVFSKENIVNRYIEYKIDSIPCGRYAISVLDDENNDHKMEYNGIGIPREGWGFSNNPGFFRLKVPDFEECVFDVTNNTKEIAIKMNYLSGSNKTKE